MMTKDQYHIRLAELAHEWREKKEKLQEEYAMANNTYKIGDNFTDRIGTIKILSIDWSVPHTEMPCCVYTGVELKKDGYAKIKAPEREAWQCNEIKQRAR